MHRLRETERAHLFEPTHWTEPADYQTDQVSRSRQNWTQGIIECIKMRTKYTKEVEASRWDAC